jgi:hypothetical protein
VPAYGRGPERETNASAHAQSFAVAAIAEFVVAITNAKQRIGEMKWEYFFID